MLPSAEELQYFLEICGMLNFSRAAQKIGISQPSLSLAVKRLEHTIGATLFVRHKHGVSLTQAGKQLSLHASQLLRYWEDVKSRALISQHEVQGLFTLGCHPTIAIHMVAEFLSELLENYPKLEINLKHDLSRKITEQVISLAIDIGIVVNPIRHPDLIIKKLCDDEVTFWVGHGKKKIQDIHSKQSVILCDTNLSQTQALLSKIKKAGIVSERILTMDNLEVVAQLTAKGCGIGILPACVANSYSGKLKRIPKAPVYLDEICLIYRDENRNVQAIQTIAQIIKKFLSKSL